MSETANMREARLQLARALMNDPARRKDAENELRLALAEPGEEPPDWRLCLYLGELAGDRAAALSQYLAALAAAPAPDVGEPTDAALAVLGGSDGPSLASGLDAQDVRKLVEVAGRGNCHPKTVKLAVHILLLRGEIYRAGPLLSAAADSQIQGDPALRAAYTVSHAFELVEQGDEQAALDLLTQRDLPPYEAAAATVHALALYGLGRLDEVLRVLTDTAPTFDTAAVRALVWLRLSGESAESERRVAIAEADKAASAAARLDPSRGDGLLLRAQVTLEGTTNVEGGRRLLSKAVHRLETRPEQALFWRVQQRVRRDDLFRYVTFEAAAACGRGADLLALRPGQLPLRNVTSLQNGLLAELAAVAYRDVGRPDDAENFFEAAIGFYDNANEPDRTLTARQALAVLRPTVARSLELAEQWWLASFRADTQGRMAVSAAVQQGLSVLDELDTRAPDQAPGDRIQGAYIRGLLLAQHQAGKSPTWRDCWAPLPWLLIAAFENPDHSYRATHLASALDRVRLRRPALYFAERALETDADDSWIQQLAIITRFNWYGMLDSDTSKLVDRIDAPEWREAGWVYGAILRDDVAELRKVADRITFDALWAHELRAIIVTRFDGLPAAETLLRALLDEALREEPAEHETATFAALALRDMKASRQYIDTGMRAGDLSARMTQFCLDVVGLLNGEAGSLQRAVDYIHTMECPFELRTHAHMVYPVLAAAWVDTPRATVQLEQLRQEALTKLGEVAAKPLPPLTVELDHGKVSSLDPALDQLIGQLLRIEELRSQDKDAAAEVLRRLTVEFKDETIGSTLRAAIM